MAEVGAHGEARELRLVGEGAGGRGRESLAAPPLFCPWWGVPDVPPPSSRTRAGEEDERGRSVRNRRRTLPRRGGTRKRSEGARQGRFPGTRRGREPRRQEFLPGAPPPEYLRRYPDVEAPPPQEKPADGTRTPTMT